jgi:hypothetical protein
MLKMLNALLGGSVGVKHRHGTVSDVLGDGPRWRE